MIAIDTSSMVAYLSGAVGNDVSAVDLALRHRLAAFPPVVLSELLSQPGLSADAQRVLQAVPLLAISEGYWVRTGRLRAKLVALGRKARLADSLVAQSCLDRDVPLVTRDTDFHHFASHAGLKLFP